MVIVMNLRRGTCWLAPLLISTLIPAGLRAASLAEVKAVYLFPMDHGLDQYLADRLTEGHIFRVVTDPKAADAVITDQLGKGFEAQLLLARPDLKPVPPKPPVTDKDKDKDKDKDDQDKSEKKEDEPFSVPPGLFHGGRGTVFLVDAKSQQVVWSNYQKPTSHTPEDMERMATRIVKSLGIDLNPPPPKGKK
jgi:hypothetical protein